MIPKVIHYCWFGGNELPELAKKCIDSWKKKCPDYELKLWDESNFDVQCCDYVKEAYEAKKWAFVSDYARFWILYNYGGVYFDTDVEILQGIDDIIEKGPFMGFEADGRLNVAPGLGIAADKKNAFYLSILEYYNKIHFILPNGDYNQKPVGEHITRLLENNGLEKRDSVQQINGIYIYPTDFFCPKNVLTGETIITENTRTIHYYTASWYTGIEAYYRKIENKFKAKGKILYFFARCYTAPFRIIDKIKKIGVVNAIKYIPKYLSKGKYES